MDIQRYFNRQSISFNPTWTDVLVLTGSSAKKYTIPTNTEKMFIGSSIDVVVKFGDSDVAATIPVADVLTGEGGFFNPGMIDIPAGVTHMSIISAESGNAYVSVWRK